MCGALTGGSIIIIAQVRSAERVAANDDKEDKDES